MQKANFEKSPLLPFEKFPSLVQPRNAIWFQHHIIQFARYYLLSGHLREVQNKIKIETSFSKARFKRRILHAPNRIAKLSACKMRRLNQLNATYFNSMRVSRIFD